MSHIVTIKTEVRDAAAVRAACHRLGLAAPTQGTVKLFSGEATGLAVKLPDWTYTLHGKHWHILNVWNLGYSGFSVGELGLRPSFWEVF